MLQDFFSIFMLKNVTIYDQCKVKFFHHILKRIYSGTLD